MNSATENTRKPIVSIEWSVQDLMQKYGLSESNAAEVLADIADKIEDRSIELGWSIIDSHLTELCQYCLYSEQEAN